LARALPATRSSRVRAFDENDVDRADGRVRR
jgi:hypothetical protein